MPIINKVLPAHHQTSFQPFQLIKGLKPFNNISQTGHWKQLTVRTSRNGDVMVWAILHPQNMSDDDKKKLKDELIEHFDNEQGLGHRKWTVTLSVSMINLKFQQRFSVPFQSCPSTQNVKVTSLHIQFFVRKEKGAPDPPIEHISGTPSIKERLFSLSFSVSPQAFFQVMRK